MNNKDALEAFERISFALVDPHYELNEVDLEIIRKALTQETIHSDNTQTLYNALSRIEELEKAQEPATDVRAVVRQALSAFDISDKYWNLLDLDNKSDQHDLWGWPLRNYRLVKKAIAMLDVKEKAE